MLNPTNTDTLEQRDALRNFAAAPELAALEKLVGDVAASQLHGLQDFAGSPDLVQLNALIAESQSQPEALDWLAIIGEWGRESVHSNFLAWLLNPAANHGIGDYFLKNFLPLAGEPPAVGAAADWSNSEVQLEWFCVVDEVSSYLDLLILNHSAQFLCAIENKIFAPEGGDQLTRYRKGLAAAYPDYTRRHIFLSPRGIPPQWPEEQEYWTPMGYTAILKLVDQTAADDAVSISEDVRVFLRQYATTLRRNIVPEATEIQQLARKIYLEHRETIALIYQHRPNWVSETMPILKEAVADQNGWMLDKEDTGNVRFRSADWDKFPATRTGTGWDPSPALLLFQFAFYNGKPWLDLYLAPGTDETVRGKLLDAARQNPAVFRRTASSLGDGWTRLHGEADYILDDSDYGVGWDDGTTRKKIMTWVADFAKDPFPQMNEIIVNCLREYEAEQAQQPGQ